MEQNVFLTFTAASSNVRIKLLISYKGKTNDLTIVHLTLAATTRILRDSNSEGKK